MIKSQGIGSMSDDYLRRCVADSKKTKWNDDRTMHVLHCGDYVYWCHVAKMSAEMERREGLKPGTAEKAP